MSDRRNLVIVTVDCLRADFVTADTMPLTLAMARQGTVYTNAYANGCGTPDSFPAIFASRLARPFAHRAGMAADEVGRMVLDGVRANEGFIFTHDDSRERIEQRMQRIGSGLDRLASRGEGLNLGTAHGGT